jgi:hypothetical protein
MSNKLRLHLGLMLAMGGNDILPMFEPPESKPANHSANRMPKKKPKKPKRCNGKK